MIKIIFAWIFALIFTGNAIAVTFRYSWHGTLILWSLSLLSWIYIIFHRKIDDFCKQGIGRILKYGFYAGIFVFLSILLLIVVRGNTNMSEKNEKAILILGAGLTGNEVTNVLRFRLEAGLAAYTANPEAILVVSGGQGPNESISEALAMKRWLVDHGVPETSILMEDQSRSTEENFLFSIRELEKIGIYPDQPIAVVTNSFHIYRSMKMAEKAGLENPRSIPAAISPTSILPSYTREVAAVLYYWLFKL